MASSHPAPSVYRPQTMTPTPTPIREGMRSAPLLFSCSFPGHPARASPSVMRRIYEAQRALGFLHRPKQETHTRKCPFCLQAEFPGCFHQRARAGAKPRPGTAGALRPGGRGALPAPRHPLPGLGSLTTMCFPRPNPRCSIGPGADKGLV